MTLFGRFPTYPGLTNHQGCLSQLHSQSANCFICRDLDLRHKGSLVEKHIPYTFICFRRHEAITVALNGNLYATALGVLTATLLLLSNHSR